MDVRVTESRITTIPQLPLSQNRTLDIEHPQVTVPYEYMK